MRSEGLEHGQSSDNGVAEHGFSSPKLAMLYADLLPHECTHSWNGKYRRPAGLATPDYATPMQGKLLWVYEGMTQYWGKVLAARTGLLTPEQYRESLALAAARMDQRPGRTWRNLRGHRHRGADPTRRKPRLEQLETRAGLLHRGGVALAGCGHHHPPTHPRSEIVE